MRKINEVTINNIAEKLNLSVVTVNRALKNDPVVSNETKKKILELVNEMKYTSNQHSRIVGRKQTKTIGVIVHELKSSFINSVLTGIEKVTNEAGYDLIITHSSESFIKEAANAKSLFSKKVDGLIASLSCDTIDMHHFQPFVNKGLPVMFFDRVEQDCNCTVVIIDNYKCGYQATQHLVEQGCRRIAHVTSNLKRNVYSQRLKGYTDALYDNGISYDESLLIIKDLSDQAGLDAAKQMLRINPMPDGVFITNDYVAAVCMRTLQDYRVRVPEDIAIVGFNNDAIATLIEPGLTTINYPGLDMGEIAARNMVAHLQGISNIYKTNTIIMRSDLVIRESSLKKGTFNTAKFLN
jgi:LacI family transcriptional regulator